MRRVYIVAYDISDDKRLRRVFKTMRGYGDSLQYSVFRCELSKQEKVLLLEALSQIIHHREDQILLMDFGPASSSPFDGMEYLGRPPVAFVREAVVI